MNPDTSWNEACWVWQDAADFPDVRRAADGLMSALLGTTIRFSA